LKWRGETFELQLTGAEKNARTTYTVSNKEWDTLPLAKQKSSGRSATQRLGGSHAGREAEFKGKAEK